MTLRVEKGAARLRPLMHRFDISLSDLAVMADALSDAPDLATMRSLLCAELGRLTDAAGAIAAQVIVYTGAESQDVVTFSVPADAEQFDDRVVQIASSEPFSGRIAPGRVSVVDLCEAPEVAELLAPWSISQVWMVGGARSLHPSNCAVFAFTGDAPTLSRASATTLSIRCTLLMSRAMGRLARLEWDVAASSASRESFTFQTDPQGMLERWPFPLVGADAHIAEQVITLDRRPLFAAIDALLSGADDAYSIVVRAAALPESRAAVRLLARRSPSGGVEGVVLPPTHPIQMLPQRLAGALSPREREVAGLVASGLRVRQITQQLYVSENTVRNHLKSIFAKLGVASQAELLDEIARADGPADRPVI